MTNLIKRIILSNKAPKPIGPYSQGVIFNNIFYASGVIGVDKDTMKLVDGGVAAETKQALQNLGYILEEAGSSFNDIIKSTVLLNDIQDFATVNDIYKQFFNKDFPARSTYQVGKLPLGAKVEIEVIAAILKGNCKSKI